MRLREKTTATLLTTMLLAIALLGVVSARPLPRGIDQYPAVQRMRLELKIGDAPDQYLEGPFYYRTVDDGDVSYHAVLVVDEDNIEFVKEGDELLCQWKLLDEGYWGWIINAKDFNMHLYPAGPRVEVTAELGEIWRFEQPVEGHSYGAVVTGYLYQIKPA